MSNSPNGYKLENSSFTSYCKEKELLDQRGSRNLQPPGWLKLVRTHKSRKAISHADSITEQCCQARKEGPDQL